MNWLAPHSKRQHRLQPLAGFDRRRRGKRLLCGLGLVLLAAVTTALLTGASPISLPELARLWHMHDWSRMQATRDYIVVVDIRLPRIILAALVGAALAVSGVLMQGLFRNPLADPGIVGVSSGAALGAIAFIVLGQSLPVALVAFLGSYPLIVGAFAGGLAVSFLLYAIATRHGRTSIATMLLAGIAIAALSGAVLGLLIFVADDRQLRDISFWSLGSLAGATWWRVALAGPVILPGLCLACVLARALNAMSLGEAVAGHLGFSVQGVKNAAIILVSLLCGAAVAVSGGIGFIGIVVPHLLRLSLGPDHRSLLPCSALLGAIVLIGADTVARSVVAPAELPIGIVTAAFGAPFFLWVLLRQREVVDL